MTPDVLPCAPSEPASLCSAVRNRSWRLCRSLEASSLVNRSLKASGARVSWGVGRGATPACANNPLGQRVLLLAPSSKPNPEKSMNRFWRLGSPGEKSRLVGASVCISYVVRKSRLRLLYAECLRTGRWARTRRKVGLVNGAEIQLLSGCPRPGHARPSSLCPPKSTRIPARRVPGTRWRA